VGGVLTVEQDSPPADGGLVPVKRGNVGLTVAHPSPNQAVYTLN
jgi:hypothetical protein